MSIWRREEESIYTSLGHGPEWRENLWKCLELMRKGVAELEEVLHLIVWYRNRQLELMVIVSEMILCILGKP